MMHYQTRPHHKVLFDKGDELVIKKTNFAQMVNIVTKRSHQ